MNALRCDHCGKFIGYEEKYSSDFVPDNAFSPEQHLTRCEKCTKTFGKPKCFVI